MSYDELKHLSQEDLSIFEERLTAFFKMSVHDSFIELRKHLEKRFPPSRFSDSDELIDNSITRLTRKIIEFEKRGERILDIKAFATRVASLIVLEHGRAKRKTVGLDCDAPRDPESPRRELRYLPDADILAIERELEAECMKTCLEELSHEKRTLLFDYYPAESVTPQVKKELRLKLALSEAGGIPGTSSEPSKRQLNNLQVKVSKVKAKLAECLEKCLEAKRSRNSRLIYLLAQRTGM